MRKSRFSERQIIGVLREQEGGAPSAEVCRRNGIIEQTFYCWKAKYGGMGPSDAQHLKSLAGQPERRRAKRSARLPAPRVPSTSTSKTTRSAVRATPLDLD